MGDKENKNSFEFFLTNLAARATRFYGNFSKKEVRESSYTKKKVLCRERRA
jgi:hypothetical protein